MDSSQPIAEPSSQDTAEHHALAGDTPDGRRAPPPTAHPPST